MTKLRIAFASSLLLTTCGCALFVPAFDRTIAGRDASRQIGAKHGRRPLTIGMSGKPDVLRVLGEPDRRSIDDRQWYYFWRVRNGTWIQPFIGTFDQNGWRTLELQFRPDGQLFKSNLFKRDGDPMDNDPGLPALPRDVEFSTAENWQYQLREFDVHNRNRVSASP